MFRSNVKAPFRPPRPLNNGKTDSTESKITALNSSLSSSSTSSSTSSSISSSTSLAAKRVPFKRQRINDNNDNNHNNENNHNHNHNNNNNTNSSNKTKYIVQWRKVTNKKIKTWDGDGTLVIDGDTSLLHIDNKFLTKPIGKFDGIIKVGSYEIEIDCEVGDENVPTKPPTEAPTKAPTKAPIKTPIKTPTKPPQLPRPNNLTNPNFIMKRPPLHLIPTGASINDVSIDPSLVKHLRPHQKDGLSFLYDGVMGYKFNGNGVLLADEMGLGKTLMTVSLLWTLLKQSPFTNQKSVVNKVLIVCPVTIINNWRREFKKWLDVNRIGVLVIDNNKPNYKQDVINFNKTNVYQVLIMGYEKLLNCQSELSNSKFDLLVCDEGHKLKNNNNKALKILKSLCISKKVLLSGTPIQNNLTEFYTLINFLNDNILGTFQEFQKNFIRPIERSRDNNCFNQQIIEAGDLAATELYDITNKFILRRTNEVLFDYLNSKTDILLFVKPTPIQLNLFKSILKTISFSDDNSLNLINVFKKICNSPSLLTDDSFYQSLCLTHDLPITSGKISALIMILIEANKNKEKVVLVSNYTKTLDILQSIVLKLNYEFLRLDGSTNSTTRNDLIKKFNNTSFPNNQIFLLSSKSGGVGINLIGASRLILFDNDWNPSNDLQAMSRIHRDGQTKPVFIYRLFTTGSIDEKIFQRQLMKNNLSNQFLNLENSHINLNVFSMEDLKDIFTIHEDTTSNTHDLVECECEGEGYSFIEGGTEESEQDEDNINDSEESTNNKNTNLQNLGWISALNYSQIDQNETKKKTTIQNALSDYKHYNPGNNFNCHDNILNAIVNNCTNNDLSISYIFTKVSNANV